MIFWYKGYGTKGSYQAPVCEYQWASCRCTYQVSISSEVWIFLWQAWCSSKKISLQGETMMIIQNFLARRNDEYMDSLQKGRTSRRYRLSSKRKNRLKIWTLLVQGGSWLMIWILSVKGEWWWYCHWQWNDNEAPVWKRPSTPEDVDKVQHSLMDNSILSWRWSCRE